MIGNLTTLYIPESTGFPSLDSITVFWQDFGPRRGQVTIHCYGSAWTAYFGGIPADSIAQFFADADVSYMVGKLLYSKWIKQGKQHEAYLRRIVCAIKAALASSPASQSPEVSNG